MKNPSAAVSVLSKLNNSCTMFSARRLNWLCGCAARFDRPTNAYLQQQAGPFLRRRACGRARARQRQERTHLRQMAYDEPHESLSSAARFIVFIVSTSLRHARARACHLGPQLNKEQRGTHVVLVAMLASVSSAPASTQVSVDWWHLRMMSRKSGVSSAACACVRAVCASPPLQCPGQRARERELTGRCVAMRASSAIPIRCRSGLTSSQARFTTAYRTARYVGGTRASDCAHQQGGHVMAEHVLL